MNNVARSHRKFEALPDERIISDKAATKKYLELDLVNILDRDTDEGEQAWLELCDHHCIPFPKHGKWVLDEFFADEEEPDSEMHVGYLHPLVMRYVESLGINLDDYDDILLAVDW